MLERTDAIPNEVLAYPTVLHDVSNERAAHFSRRRRQHVPLKFGKSLPVYTASFVMVITVKHSNLDMSLKT